VSAEETHRLPDALVAPGEEEFDRTLRPHTLAEFVGQTQLKDQLSIFLDAAKGRGEPCEHVLLAGPPGLGKTSLAGIIAVEMNSTLRIASGPAIDRKADMAAILTALESHDVLFIDEIHRISRAAEEILYPALEDFRLDIVMGQGPAARTLTLDLPPFTLVGATTRTGLLTTPLRDRFGITHRLDYYDIADIQTIVERSAGVLGVAIDTQGAAEIARRARGTPRVANRILRRVRDFAQVRHQGAITHQIAIDALELFEVDSAGLERIDRAILSAIAERFSGGPVGLSTLAVAIGEETDTLEDVYEPFLLQLGMIQRTPRGRIVTPAGYAHLGLKAPARDPGLF
jgi:Holliday junction DNA helicase RuvB